MVVQTTISRTSPNVAISRVSSPGMVMRSRLTTLDFFNGGPNNDQPHLTKCGDLSGQLWVLTKTDKRVESGTKTD